jgi:hypothetical protein
MARVKTAPRKMRSGHSGMKLKRGAVFRMTRMGPKRSRGLFRRPNYKSLIKYRPPVGPRSKVSRTMPWRQAEALRYRMRRDGLIY